MSGAPIEAIARKLCDDTLKRWRSPFGVKAEPWREFIPAAQAALTAITEAGFSIVPNEPTEAMIDAGCAAYWPIGEFVTGSLTNGERTTQCYRAMITAANKESRE